MDRRPPNLQIFATVFTSSQASGQLYENERFHPGYRHLSPTILFVGRGISGNADVKWCGVIRMG